MTTQQQTFIERANTVGDRNNTILLYALSRIDEGEELDTVLDETRELNSLILKPLTEAEMETVIVPVIRKRYGAS